MPWQEQVLQFWFSELKPHQWFRSSVDLDETIRERFGALHGQLVQTPVEELLLLSSPLAAIIVLDQFSRNLGRGTAEAFAADTLSLRLAQEAVKRGVHKRLTPSERTFLLMPFMHSEVLSVQRRSLELFHDLDNSRRSAQQHFDIIARFGRFPHRNLCLGRQSTVEELVYLEDGDRFGQ